MLSIKEKIPFLKSKTLDEYNQTILTPSFNMIEMSRNAKDIGLDVNIYKQVINTSKNINSKDNNRKVMKLINYLNKIVFDDDCLKQIVSKIIFVTNYGKFRCKNRSFVGYVNINKHKYKYAIEIDTKSIVYGYEYLDQKEKGIFSVNKDGIKIKNIHNGKTIKGINGKKYIIENNYIHLKIYDNNYNQNFKHTISQSYHYYLDKDKKIIDSKKNNYTKDIYIWKCPNNSIIKKVNTKYVESKETEECFICKNISPNNNKLPNNGVYYQFDNKLFQDYYNNRCDLSTIWDNALIYKR